MKDMRFDPDWRDDICDPIVLDFPLIFPKNTSKDCKKSVWIQSRFETAESFFGEQIKHGRVITYLLKRSDKIQHNRITDSKGNAVEQDDEIYDVIFPPQAWMTDSFQERCMVYAAAKHSRGKVLVGGLGLAIYPQICFFLHRPIDSVTVIEKEQEVINLVMDALHPQLLDETKSRLHVTEGDIAQFLQNSSELFDTIYLDVWENMDPRLLPGINHLVQLALIRCAPWGQIHCWGYARMVESFTDHAAMYVQKELDFNKYYLDPAMERFAAWFAEHPDASLETIKSMSREIVLTTVKPFDTYDALRCLTPFARSWSEMARNLKISQK